MSLPILEENQQLSVALKNPEGFSDKIKSIVQEIKDKKTTVLLVNECFETIQCEGISMGKPVVFIRTYGCNLKCGFANPDGTPGCDTPYTWKKSATTDSDINRYTPEMLVKEILQYKNHSHWVVTGGEPVLQSKKLALVALEYQKQTGELPYIEVETNGTLIPDQEFDSVVGHYNVSLKLENSNATVERGFKETDEEFGWNTPERRVKADAVNWFNSCPKAYFKFVVDKEQTVIGEIQDLQKDFSIENEKVWLMPEGNSAEDILSASAPLIETCIQHGYRFTPRYHILTWGFLRGK